MENQKINVGKNVDMEQLLTTPELVELTAEVRRQRELLGHKHDWVPEPADGAYNVLIIGGGQAGLGTAFALQRQRIGKVKVLEAATPSDVGCWARYARMHTLRSPKHMKGLELDVPALHVQSWFEAKYGADAWDETRLVPRLDWNEYLTWYREAAGIDVQYGSFVTDVAEPDDDGYFSLTVQVADGNGEVEEQVLRARRVVYALGLDGGGGPNVPAPIRALPENLWAHTEDAIDFEALAGKRVLILGGGASGFDNASAVLDAGATSATVFMRRAEVPSNNPLRWMEFPGMQEHYFDLTDQQKWDFTEFNGGLPQPPTQASIWRAFEHPGFRLERGVTWSNLTTREAADGSTEVVVTTSDDCEEVADFVIAATGYAVDLALRPELKNFIDDIALWEDRFEPAVGHPLGKSPYLGDGFQFLPKDGSPEYISRLFHLSTGARVSHGVAGNQLSGIFAGLNRVAHRIASDVTQENWADFMEEFRDFEALEISSVGKHDQAKDEAFASSPRFKAGDQI